MVKVRCERMIAVIVSSFDTYLERIELLKEYYEKQRYEVYVIVSDFRHFKKEKVLDKKEDFWYISTKPYFKNISFRRLHSHYCFAKDAFTKVKELHPDILHVLVPANSLAKEASLYKKKHSNVKLYLDLIDLWPETMPIGMIKKYFPFTVWKNVRDKNLYNADIVFTECNLYRNVLGKEKDQRFVTLHWAKKDGAAPSNPVINNANIELCYLGSINNIIDIDCIIGICTILKKEKLVKLHIIGNGEKKDELLQKLMQNDITFVDHGTIYDKKEKQVIFDQCDFGLNIMKNNVCVGLTMKSLDYLQGGLPMINNIKFDTAQLIDQYSIGVNVVQDFSELDKLDKVVRENVRKVYEEKFSKKAMFQKLDETIKE